MARFRINYSQVIRQADTINNLSSDLDREIRKLDSMLNASRSSWIGPAATAYYNHLTLLIADMKKTKYSMSSVSSTIKNVATRIQREDERQAELARRLAAKKSN
ncbi:MAG: WXG100 family type VII secretion target [Butyrivibrio sp.]|nr:WXG100 family type VII secretion target [Butyrivibrio sp.]MBR4640999.1 WXG100 family type VII secretion target [Butyrivibrio sp.]